MGGRRSCCGVLRGHRLADRSGAQDPPHRSPGLGASSRPLTVENREEITIGLSRQETFSSIASRIGMAVSTVSREVGANGGRDGYRAWAAHQRAWSGIRRPKPSKFERCPKLATTVTGWLEKLWSPEEIANRLRSDFPGDPMMQVSHDTIYKSLYVQGRGELRRELTRCLRSGRTIRKSHATLRRGDRRVPDMVMISDRPPEVEDRVVPGHWEGDLIVGRNQQAAVGTLVERTTRYVMLLHLPDGRTRCTDGNIRRRRGTRAAARRACRSARPVPGR